MVLLRQLQESFSDLLEVEVVHPVDVLEFEDVEVVEDLALDHDWQVREVVDELLAIAEVMFAKVCQSGGLFRKEEAEVS